MRLDALPTSRHFTLEPLAEGVFAVIATPGGAAYSNSGIIDLGDTTIILDTGDNPLGAIDLRSASISLTGREPAWVINSHYHGDHVGGNMIFTNSAIISTVYTRRMIAASAKEIEEMKQNLSEIEEEIQQCRQRLEAESDPNQRRLLEIQISRSEYTLQTLPDYKTVLPDSTFEGKFIFYGSSRSAALIAPGVGHTQGDCYLHLEKEGILFLGDLGFFQAPPFMGGSDPSAWISRLEQFENSDCQVFVPGHGSVGSKIDLKLQREYIQLVVEMASKGRQAGMPLENLLQQSLPAPFDDWVKASRRHERNLRYLYEVEE